MLFVVSAFISDHLRKSASTLLNNRRSLAALRTLPSSRGAKRRGICFSLTLEADPVLFGVARAMRALPLLLPQKQDYSLAKRNRSARATRATPDKLLRAPASRSLVASLLGMTFSPRRVCSVSGRV